MTRKAQTLLLVLAAVLLALGAIANLFWFGQ